MDNNDLHIVQQVSSGRLKGIFVNVLSDEDAKNISAMVIGTVNEVEDAALGLPTINATECLTCGAKNSRDCEGHFGLINFPFTILNPYFMSEIAQILNRICPGCKSIRHSKVEKADSASSHQQSRNCKYCNAKSKYGYPKMKFRVSSKDVFAKTAIIAEVSETLVDKNSVKSLASDYWDVIPKDSTSDHSGMLSNRRVLLPAQVYRMLKDVCPRTLEILLKRKNLIFLNSLLVTPNGHRVREFGQRIAFDETTRMYRKLIDFRGSPNELGARVLDRYKVSKICSEKLSSWQQIYEKQSTNDSVSSASGLKNIKELLLGKRTDHSFRMVVVGDPRLRVDEIGIPVRIAERMQISEYINSWNWEKLEPLCDSMLDKKGNISVLRNGERISIYCKKSLQLGDQIFRCLTDGDILLINRPPSIHQHSLIASCVKVLPVKSVVSINPLICSPIRGDFDGDCLHGYIPQSVNSRVELKELVSLKEQLFNGQNGQNLLSLSQDSLTAAFLIMEDGIVLDKTEMQQLQMFCSRTPTLPAVIKSVSSEISSWTGKQLFSLLLPPDFEFEYSSNGVSIRQGDLVLSSNGSSWLRDSSENLFQCLLKHCHDRALDILYRGQEVLCEWLSRRGLSVSLSDLYLSSDGQSRKNLLDDISCGLQEAEKLSDISSILVECYQILLAEGQNGYLENFVNDQMSVAQKNSAERLQASISASKSVFSDMQNLVYKYSGCDNSLMAMLKAGSKGNLQKLVQHSMCLGLQHSLAPLSFSIPRKLSCASWNNHKNHFGLHGPEEITGSYIPCSVVANSYLAGLNPLECFIHSLTTRDTSFSGHADVSGTLSRRLMFFMRDLVVGYDETVRSCYGNQIVQFNYCSGGSPATHSDVPLGGHPVGALAACAISEAAYSALDQPVSAIEPSSLLALKKILESGVKKSSGGKRASLFLSKILRRWTNGFEYGALEIKHHLEILLFSDIVSEITIRQTYCSTRKSPLVCHFHIKEEVVKKRRLKLRSVINALYTNCNGTGGKSKINLPNLRIISKVCCESDVQKTCDSIICILVASMESFEEFSDLDILRDMVIPVLLQTVIKGFPEFKKVDILWKDEIHHSKGTKCSSGELYLRVGMSGRCERGKLWSIIKDRCLPVRNIIDWERSHPDDIHEYTEAYGIDVAWQYFVNSLHSAISDTGKTILPEHLSLTANCLSLTGEFVALNAKGLAHQRKEASICSPFSLACFSNPSDCLVKAAKTGQKDGLRGSLEALAWGQTPSIGTGCQFDIIYNGKGHEPAKPTDVYSLLSAHVKSTTEADKVSGKSLGPNSVKQDKSLVMRTIAPQLSEVGLKRVSQTMKNILRKYPLDQNLQGQEKSTAMEVFAFHPRWKDKVGTGIMEIKVGRHPTHQESCFFLVRTDGTQEDFSYNKCIDNALKQISSKKVKTYRSKRYGLQSEGVKDAAGPPKDQVNGVHWLK